MNPYLEKIAKEKKTNPVGELALAGAGYTVAKHAPAQLLGYHNVYHGTTKPKARDIRKTGFKSGLGGTGASELSPSFKSESLGKIHVTKNRLLAKMYSGNPAFHAKKIKERDGFMFSAGEAMGKSFKDGMAGKGAVVKARIPHSVWSKMKVDKDSSQGSPETPFVQSRMKERASTYHKNIGAQFVERGANHRGVSGYLTKNNLRRYYGTSSGKTRALMGVARLAVGGSAMAVAAKHNSDNQGVLSKLKRNPQ